GGDQPEGSVRPVRPVAFHDCGDRGRDGGVLEGVSHDGARFQVAALDHDKHSGHHAARFRPAESRGSEQDLREPLLRPPPLLIPKLDTLEHNHGYYLPENKAWRVKDAAVLLVLCSVNTGEKLSNLAALLTSHVASSIWVLCLVNRMGKRTTDFHRRINNMMKGL